jgi:hypothetical protein
MRRSLAIAYSRIGGLLAKQAARYAEAYPMTLRSMAITDSMLAEDPRNADLRKFSAYDRLVAGEAAAHMGDAKDARLKRQEGLDRVRALLAAEPESEAFKFDVSWALGDLAESLHTEGDLGGAVELLMQAQATLKALPGATSSRLNTTQFLIAVNDMRLGLVRISQASAARTRAAELRALWTEGKTLLERAAIVFTAAANDAVFSAEAVTYTAATKSGLSRCETALGKLGAR